MNYNVINNKNFKILNDLKFLKLWIKAIVDWPSTAISDNIRANKLVICTHLFLYAMQYKCATQVKHHGSNVA